MVLAALALASTLAVPNELGSYLRKPDKSYSYRVLPATGSIKQVELTSQTWKGQEWKHGILLSQPEGYKGDLAVLYITGDGPRDGDRLQLGLFSGATRMPIAMLFDVPNQPIFGMREDDLIAHTFEQYLATGDSEWPLLFPMTKSALRAMDAIQAISKKEGHPIKRFLVTGASKRGWTTWLVGASGDPRVAGIAPMVIDNLNIPAQMRHQISSWGKYSEMIDDYTRRGLQQKLSTRSGRRLTEIVDPYSYRSQIRVPTLIVTGGNDRYWTADAMSQYWNGLSMPRWARMVPNVGHDLGGGAQAIETIGAFARALAGQYPFPRISSTLRQTGSRLLGEIKVAGLPASRVSLWAAAARTNDFRESTWTKLVDATQKKQTFKVSYDWVGEPMNLAAMMEVRFQVKGQGFSLTTPVAVFR